MKKTQKAALSILLVLALLATLPMTVMAEEHLAVEDMPADGYESNTTPNVIVDSGVTVGINTGDNVTNNGTIETNTGDNVTNGTPKEDGTNSNPTSGTVVENKSGATISDNYGTVKENEANGTITDNYGLVGELQYGNPTDTAGNYGTVVNNHAGGAVVNREGGIVENNSSRGGSGAYRGVFNYGGTVGKNSGVVINHSGTVEVNEPDGTVYNDCASPEAADGPNVITNYGEVQYYDSTNITPPPYYGVHFVNDENEMVYLGQYKGAAVPWDTAEEVTIEKLQANCKDYKIIGIEKVEDYSRKENKFVDHNEGTVESADDGTGDTTGSTTPLTSFKISAPTRLTLILERIASIFKPASTASSGNGGGGAEAVELSARKRYIGLGSVIFINEKGYKVVELKDDAYVVVSFDALSDEDVKDLDALFAKLFTTEQQAQIKNVGQLLDAEDVLAVFDKPGNHPVYEVNKALVE